MAITRITRKEVFTAASIAVAYWIICHFIFAAWIGISSIEAVLAANAITALAVLTIAWFALGIFAIRVVRVAFLSVLFI